MHRCGRGRFENQRALILGPSQNSTVTACKNDAAPVFKNNARIDFRGRLGISRRRPGKTMLPSFWKTMRALFSGPFQHLTSKTRQIDYAVEFKKICAGFSKGCDDTSLATRPKTAPQIFVCARQVYISLCGE
jgi:hypothetical protein